MGLFVNPVFPEHPVLLVVKPVHSKALGSLSLPNPKAFRALLYPDLRHHSGDSSTPEAHEHQMNLLQNPLTEQLEFHRC